jgi:polar amino acid transport system substrate-binding protein
VTVISSSDENLEPAAAMGLDEGIHYTNRPEWGKMVRKRLAGDGVDPIVALGGEKTLPCRCGRASISERSTSGLIPVRPKTGISLPSEFQMIRNQRRISMRKSPVAVFVVVMLSLLFAASVHAGPVLDRILKEKMLRVGTSGTQPPMTAVTKTGERIGMDIDIARTMAAAMGVEVEFVPLPFGKLLPALESGSVDMVISGMTITPARNRSFAFVGPYLLSGKGILAKSARYLELQEAAGLNTSDVTISVLKGSTSQQFAEKLIPKAKLVPVDSYEEAIEMIKNDVADVLIADYPFCALTAYRNRASGMISGEHPLTYEPIGIAMPEDALLINWTQNFLSLLQGTGQLKALQQKWLTGGAWVDQLP